MGPFLVIERDGPVVTATINRPDQRNAISTADAVLAVETFCRDIARDASVRAIVLTGAGTAFCAGGNVKDMAARSGMFAGSPYALRNAYRDGMQRIPMALYELEVPVVAAIKACPAAFWTPSPPSAAPATQADINTGNTMAPVPNVLPTRATELDVVLRPC